MDDFKDWYSNKKGKQILFFGFYIIFFAFLAIYIRSANNNKPEEPKKEEIKPVERITTYDITDLLDNDYQYEIVINDNEEIISFNGSKSNVDYNDFANKYFLDIYNINQLLKKSKFVGSSDNILTYELSNTSLNEILLTDKKDGSNKIFVYVKDDTKVERIVLDLANYLEKQVYQINIKYTVGVNNENSSS